MRTLHAFTQTHTHTQMALTPVVRDASMQFTHSHTHTVSHKNTQEALTSAVGDATSTSGKGRGFPRS